MNVVMAILWLALAWWLLAAPLGVLLGKMIKLASRQESLAGGIVARAFREASEPTIWDRWDEIIDQGGHDAVLQQFPESFARIFTLAGQPCKKPRPDVPDLHWWDRVTDGDRNLQRYECRCGATTKNSTFADSQNWEAKEIQREATVARRRKMDERIHEYNSAQRKKELDFVREAAGEPMRAEVHVYGKPKAIRSITEDDFTLERSRQEIELALQRNLIGGRPQRTYADGGRIVRSSDRW